MKCNKMAANEQVGMTKNVISTYHRHIYMHIHTKDEVSLTTYLDRGAYKEKYQNGCHYTTISLNE